MFELKNNAYFRGKYINMSKKIYVNGGIVITTPYFAYKGGGCKYPEPPENAEIIEPNSISDNGIPYLEISDEFPQSIFNEYYAKEFFSTKYMFAEFYHKDFNGARRDYLQRIEDIQKVINIEGLAENQKAIVNRLLYISVVASLETFVCDTILTKITREEPSFSNYFREIIPNGREKRAMQEYLNQNQIGKWEQMVINYVIGSSYSNIKKIKNSYNEILNVSIEDVDNKIKKHFDNRNIMAHKNGRLKDGSFMEIGDCNLEELIGDSNEFVQQIMHYINA